MCNNITYTTADSIKICKILSQLSKSKEKKTATIMVAAAKLLAGTPYVAGTLDKDKVEKIVVNIGEVDCTTFVEQIFAIARTISQDKKDFNSFCNNLLNIRYQKGKCNGYESRLHYFSQFVADGEEKGILHEVKNKQFTGKQNLNLSFMSNNPAKYPRLQTDSVLIAAIAEREKPFRNITINYLPKELLNKTSRQIPIKDGDIIALVTNINGLDVTHMGIAIWKGKRLHLIHASYKHKKVILDEQSLFDYLKVHKSAPGIRVVRVK